ncbi:ArnT family glycosyltransferase [Paraburkholderia caledonica]|uniref:ArnT family glycosyltransferase n=1 Tax=Paraburkholderia caledonica TaxID=134536 RepID=UPI000375FB5F|nr:glycosyltransferase family 39 protein [Paraburkholderia caledonica]
MKKNNFTNLKHSNLIVHLLFIFLLGFFVYQNVEWVIKYRFDQSLDIDESGYLAVAVAFAKAKMNGGWTGWWHAISAPLGFAPLVPLIASLVFIAFGINENLGFVCNIAFAVGTLVLMFVAAHRVSSLFGLVASILLASLPNFVMFSRSFQFVSATTFFFFAAYVFFVFSEGFSRRRYAMLSGMALGAMILSRTMALAFLPAFAFSFLVYFYRVRGFSREICKNIVASILACLLVAMPWYLENFRSVFGYLFSFGYGSHAAEYGHSQGIFTLANWKARLDVIISQIHPAHFIMIVPAFIAAFLVCLRKKNAIDSLILSGALLCLSSLFILSTSQNMGTGFDAPIYPVMILCAIMWIATSGIKWLRIAYIALSLTFLSVASYAHEDLHRCLKMPKEFVEGIWGYGPLVNCVASIHGYLRTNEFPPDNQPNFIQERDEAVAWRQLNRLVSSYLLEEDGSRSVVLLLSRHMILNANSIGLEMIKGAGTILPMVQIDPAALEPTAASYSSWLAQAPHDSACFALMLDDQHGEFFPRADVSVMTQVLSESEYERVTSFATPRSGQRLWVWQKKVPACRGLA